MMLLSFVSVYYCNMVESFGKSKYSSVNNYWLPLFFMLWSLPFSTYSCRALVVSTLGR